MKKALIRNIVLTILVIGVVICAYILIKKSFDTVGEGQIEIILEDKNGNTLFDDLYKYTKDDTLWSIILDNYNDENLLYDETDLYGVRLLGIKGVETNFTSSYLALYLKKNYYDEFVQARKIGYTLSYNDFITSLSIKDEISITNVEYSNEHIVITLSNNSTVDLGECVNVDNSLSLIEDDAYTYSTYGISNMKLMDGLVLKIVEVVL